MIFGMETPVPKNMLASLLFAAFIAGQSPNGFCSTQEACDKLYADYLQKAKQALLDNKPDDAVAFLLKASTIAESCAKADNPEGRDGPKTPALAA